MDNAFLAKRILLGKIDAPVAWILQINNGVVETDNDKQLVVRAATEAGYNVRFLNWPLTFDSHIDLAGKRISIEVRSKRMIDAARM